MKDYDIHGESIDFMRIAFSIYSRSFMKLTILPEDPHNEDALELMNELSGVLTSITGNGGQSSFCIDDLKNDKSIFLIARDENNKPIGCGAIRPMNRQCAEIKRMYSKQPQVGTRILESLEKHAMSIGYKKIRLETRKVNEKAVRFYLRNGYYVIENYGKYVGNNLAICFEKEF
ncbi:GNAT family N-acetyltransferase [Spirochaeta cellobiosiphila]|uniref:GNAT family N-acetyltransferase n=1 Tax=Spirochaeta cellobiosiphila TaxID=504483 RepID=UPI00041F6928|nr:GNAT family N-acetyltransferase [Spirochaeta cellobiosiphila]